jgi:hypothetical protein
LVGEGSHDDRAAGRFREGEHRPGMWTIDVIVEFLGTFTASDLDVAVVEGKPSWRSG